MKRSLLITVLLIGALAALALEFSNAGDSLPISAQIIGAPLPADGFSRADGSVSMSFPEDFGPHPDFQTEWWYYTGNLQAQDGRHFGYQLTFFRRALLPINESIVRNSEWGTNQIYMAHFALSDADGDAFYAYERFSRAAAGLAGAQGAPYTVWLENWRVEQTSPSQFILTAANEEVAIDIILEDEKGPVLQGDQGFSPKGPEPGNASYYYSQTRLKSTGEIVIGEEHIAVEGLSWKDHEFSTSALAPGQIGWDWFSIQLSNGYELMLFELRRSDGSIDLLSSGTLISPEGETMALSEEDFLISTQGKWKSEISGATYPMGWQLSIPAADLVLELSPYLEDQELNLSITYWEGAVFVSGSQNGQEVSGQGYVEMTGYADSLEGQF